MNLIPLIQAGPFTIIHIIFALIAVIIGFVQFISPKGNVQHRILGWAWVVAMSGVGITAIFMPHHKGYILPIPIILAMWIAIGLPLGIRAIKKGNILLHRAFMMGLYIGGLFIALAFTITPGRLLYKIFFGG